MNRKHAIGFTITMLALTIILFGAAITASAQEHSIISPRDAASGQAYGVTVPHDIMHGGPTGTRIDVPHDPQSGLAR